MIVMKFGGTSVEDAAAIRRVMERYRITDVSIIEPDIDAIVRRIYREGYHGGMVRSPS